MFLIRSFVRQIVHGSGKRKERSVLVLGLKYDVPLAREGSLGAGVVVFSRRGTCIGRSGVVAILSLSLFPSLYCKAGMAAPTLCPGF